MEPSEIAKLAETVQSASPDELIYMGAVALALLALRAIARVIPNSAKCPLVKVIRQSARVMSADIPDRE